jgi:Uma2 family endonuclease
MVRWPNMILEALTGREVRKRRSQMPQRHRNGGFTQLSGEDRLVSSGISWHSYLELDEVLGHERPGPRLYYLDGELEIMTASLLHEKLKEWIGVLVEDYVFEVGRETFPHGQATMRIFKEAGAEPDKSWCFDRDKEWPDLVLEIALTSGGIPKLEIYRRFGAPEVWLWSRSGLEIWTLRRNRAGYDGPAQKSRLLPDFDVPTLTRCLEMASWSRARRMFREAVVRQTKRTRRRR